MKSGKTVKWKERIETGLFTVPAILLVTVMMYIPFVMSGYYSLTEWNGIAKEPVFVGLANFKTILTGGSDYMGALWFTVKYTVGFVVFANVIALAVALTQKFKFVNVFRGIFFIPYIMSMTIVGFIWKFIFTQGFEKLYETTGWAFWNES